MRPPVTSDPLSALLGHNHWATHKVLGLCAGLTPEQFHQQFEIGFGSLHDTLRHMLECTRSWSTYIAALPTRPSVKPADQRFSLDEFAALLDETTEELRILIDESQGRLGELIYATLGGKQYPFTRGVALTHVLVHGTHHRAQCLNMLRRLGVANLPDIDVNDWQYETECKP
jgi:uncharacterized damage-inducible protein DinB